MTKPNETAPTLSPDNTVAAPPSGWLNKVRLPIKPGNTAQSRSKEPHNALAHAWQTSLRRNQPLQYHKLLGFEDGCRLGEFGRAVGDQAREVIEFAIANWKTFVSEAERKNGLFGSQPAEPHIPFFVKYHDCAVNLLRQSIARKKQQDEPSEALKRPQVADAKLPPQKAKSELLKVVFTHAQVALLVRNDDDSMAFLDKVTEKYGPCIMSGLAPQEMLDGFPPEKPNGTMPSIVLCDIPVRDGA